MSRRVVLAFAGYPEEAHDLAAHLEATGDEIATLTLDVGQRGDLDAARELALEAGAVRAHVLEVHDALLTRHALPVVRAGAMFDAAVPLLREITAALVVQSLSDVAGMEGTRHVAVGRVRGDEEHTRRIGELVDGVRGRGELVLESLRPGVAPGPGAGEGSAADQVAIHDSLLGRTARSAAPIADARAQECFVATRASEASPDSAALLALQIERGQPVALNGVRMPVDELIDSIETIAGDFGVGRFSGALPPTSSTRGRVFHRGEAPALTVVEAAFDALAVHALPADLVSLRDASAARLRELIRAGRWFTPTRAALLALLDSAAASMSGTVTLRLFKGGSEVTGVQD